MSNQSGVMLKKIPLFCQISCKSPLNPRKNTPEISDDQLLLIN